MKQSKPFNKPIYVANPLLPELDDLYGLLNEVWKSGQLTNNGSMARELEKEIAHFLKVGHLSLFSNGTSALQIACRVLKLSGEVITTPFTFAATPNALALNNLKPVFCDIEDETLNIDAGKIESLITPKTSAILPVHVFGNPCDTEKIEKIAKEHGLKVIYDSAHAFGVEVNGMPIAGFGDISMFSLHATKVYHTVEGGALAFRDKKMKESADLMRNFGIIDGGDVADPGMNAKLNELQAAVGILVLKMLRQETSRRREITCLYRELLKDVDGIRMFMDIKGVVHNYPYFVIRVDEEGFGMSRDELYEELKRYNVICRKYFYPLCSNFSCYTGLACSEAESLRIAERAAKQVLSLPLHGRLEDRDVEKICGIIRESRREYRVKSTE